MDQCGVMTITCILLASARGSGFESLGASISPVAPGASARETALLEKGLLFRRHVAAKTRISVRKPSDARGDDVLVNVGISNRFSIE
jgi:hypothetical protein